MEVVHGGCTWRLYMEVVHGGCTWRLYIIFYGNDIEYNKGIRILQLNIFCY